MVQDVIRINRNEFPRIEELKARLEAIKDMLDDQHPEWREHPSSWYCDKDSDEFGSGSFISITFFREQNNAEKAQDAMRKSAIMLSERNRLAELIKKYPDLANEIISSIV